MISYDYVYFQEYEFDVGWKSDLYLFMKSNNVLISKGGSKP